MNNKLLMKKKMAKRPRKRQPEAARNLNQEPFVYIGAKLQERRVALGVTQKRLAELTGLQIATISKIEKGDSGVKLGTLQIYLDLMNLTLALEEREV